MLFSACFGLEGGYSIPAVGFRDLTAGAEIEVYISQPVFFMDFAFSLGASFYSGNNPAYTMSLYHAKSVFYKKNWRFSPYFDLGMDYVTRCLGGAKEIGYAGRYSAGVLINFNREKLRIYPKFYYTGTTDFTEHGGFVGAKLGFAYDL